MTRPRERAPGGRPSPEPEGAARHEYRDLPAVGTVRPGDRTVPAGIGAQGIMALQRVAGNGGVRGLVAPGGGGRIQAEYLATEWLRGFAGRGDASDTPPNHVHELLPSTPERGLPDPCRHPFLL